MLLRKLNLPAMAVLLAMVVPTAVAQSPQTDADVVKSFQSYVANYLVRLAKKKVIHTVSGLGESVWVKYYFEQSTDVAIDVRRTNSLVSPYTGILDLTLITHYTKFHTTEAEAEADDSFKSTTKKHRHIYAFQDGAWISTSQQSFEPLLNEWFKCSDSIFKEEP